MKSHGHANIAREHLDVMLQATSPSECCEKTFWHVLEHKEHEHIHTDKKLYSCRDCCKRFKKAEPLRYQHG